MNIKGPDRCKKRVGVVHQETPIFLQGSTVVGGDVGGLNREGVQVGGPTEGEKEIPR